MTVPAARLDEMARTAIRKRLDENLVVEAGAGTGKTTVLVDRIEALVTTGRMKIQEIVAITFTRAAAAELRERVRIRFETLDHDSSPDAVRQRWVRDAIDGLDQASIQTIDSFALSILREVPLEAGLPPVLEPLDEIASELDFAERWREWLDAELEGGELSTLLGDAVRLGFTDPLRDLEHVARSFHENYDLLRGFEFADQTAPVRVAATMVIDARARARQMLAVEVPGKAEQVGEALRRLLGLADRLARCGAGSLEVMSILAEAPKLATARGNKGDWGPLPDSRLDAVSAAKELLRDLDSQIKAEVGQARTVAFAPLLRRVASFALAYADSRREAGTPNFRDLLVWSDDLLRDGPAQARLRIREKHRVVLIDEFQDTDPLQTSLARRLTSESTSSRPSPGALFVVGDPKQSIYRFRRADLTSLAAVQTAVGASPVQLTVTQRTHTGVVSWLNHVFGGWMGQDTTGLQSPYVHIVAARKSPPQDGVPCVYYVGGAVDSDSIDAVRREENEHIVEVARAVGEHRWAVVDRRGGQQVPRPSEFRDLCILFPARTALGDLERAFESAGVPYVVEGQSLVFATQEVGDLLNCLAAIDDPADEVAVVAALRTPGFGCSDTDLYEWQASGRRFNYLSDLPGVSTSAGTAESPVGMGLTALRDLNRQRLAGSTAELIERFIRDRKLRELASSGPSAIVRLRLLQTVVEQARTLEQAGRSSLREFVRWCQERRARGEGLAEGSRSQSDHDAVRLMTIHNAKGLEFPIVLLTGIGGGRAHRCDPVLFDHTGKVSASTRIAVRISGGEFVYGDHDDLCKRDRAGEEAEHVRLMYVAATRARDHLIVSMYRKAADANSTAAKLDGLVGARSPLWRELPRTAPTVLAPASSEVAGTAMAVDGPEHRQAWEERRAALIVRASRKASVSATELAAGGQLRGDATGARGRAVERAPATGSDDRLIEEPWRRGRGGTSLGRAVHATLNSVNLATGDRLDEVARFAALAEAIPEGAGEVVALARAVLGSDVVRKVVTGGRYWREVYVATPLADGVLDGVVDLVYEMPDGSLGIVDYKTDELFGRSLADAAAPHVDQIGAYALAVERTTGRRVAQAWLVFARPLAAGSAGEFRVEELEKARKRAEAAALALLGPGI